MKTRNEVLRHLLENGYSKKAINKIVGFMVAKELKALDEVVKILKGDGTFDDFFKWYHSCDTTPSEMSNKGGVEINYSSSDVIDSLIHDVLERLLFTISVHHNPNLIHRYESQLVFLMEMRQNDNEKISNED